MPIRESEKARYPRDWKAISERIRERDNHRCRWCNAPNHARIVRFRGDEGRWMNWQNEAPPEPNWHPPIVVILTVAHLDHTPENCDDANLVALCQRCHLRYDHEHHQRNARATRRARKAVGDLFGEDK